ncbi:MAG: hypothetical protein ACR2OJ_07310 [Hyphomicrobiales bacterium]
MKIIFAVIALAFTFIVVDLVPNSSLVSQAHAVTKAQKKKAWADCRKKYGKTVYKVRVKKNGEVRCHYRRNASTRKNPTSHAEATKLCKKNLQRCWPRPACGAKEWKLDPHVQKLIAAI